MQANACARFAGLGLGLALLIGGCSHDQGLSVAASSGDDSEINVYPANYKSDILGAMHAYLNDPTGIRDAGMAEPALKTVGGNTRYIVCLRFNAKKGRTDYAGTKEIAAVFIAGRFDRFVEMAHGEHEECAGAAYAPFPELQKLAR
jgi:hypothetical protein